MKPFQQTNTIYDYYWLDMRGLLSLIDQYYHTKPSFNTINPNEARIFSSANFKLSDVEQQARTLQGDPSRYLE